LLIRPVTRKVLAPAHDILTPAEQAQIAAEAEAKLSLEARKTVKELEQSLSGGLGNLMLPEAEVRKADILRQRLVEFVRHQPENSAQILRLWMAEEGK